jgi:hypothetical protein
MGVAVGRLACREGGPSGVTHPLDSEGSAVLHRSACRAERARRPEGGSGQMVIQRRLRVVKFRPGGTAPRTGLVPGR